jgi:hypothetical protein
LEHKAAGWRVADISRAVGLSRKPVYEIINGASYHRAA